MKEPNEAEYIEWEKRILKDIDEGYLKLSRLQTLKELIFSRCVILKDDGEVDYDLSTNLWHSKRAEIADQNSYNISPQIDIVSSAPDGGFTKIQLSELPKKSEICGIVHRSEALIYPWNPNIEKDLKMALVKLEEERLKRVSQNGTPEAA